MSKRKDRVLLYLLKSRENIHLGDRYGQQPIKKHGLLMLTKYLIELDKLLAIEEQTMNKIKTEEKITSVYKTTDGNVFDTIWEAEKHQEYLDNLVWYEVRYGPDLTEGRHSWTKQGYVVVNASVSQDMFVIHACHEIFGSPVAFVQGVFGSNAIIDNWQIYELNGDDVVDPKIPIIAKVEDRFAKNKMFGEGIHIL